MKKSVKLWIKALKSGEYKQGKHFLRVVVSHCCLGVACKLYNEYNHSDQLDIYIDNGKYHFDGETKRLPDKVIKWLGLNTGDGLYCDHSLSALNDAGVSFEEIADIIESEPVGLFEKNNTHT
jgi:hypothetical protein